MVRNILISFLLAAAVAASVSESVKEKPARLNRRHDGLEPRCNTGTCGQCTGSTCGSGYPPNYPSGGAYPGGYGTGGYGTTSGYTSSSSSSSVTSSSSYGYSQIYSSFQSLLYQIQQCQAALAAGGISVEVATQYLYQLAIQFQQLLTPYGGCGACGVGGADIQSFGVIIQQIAYYFQQVIAYCQSLFPSNWSGILGSAWTPLNNAFPIMLNIAQAAGLSISSYFSSSFASYFRQISNLSGVSGAFNKFGI